MATRVRRVMLAALMMGCVPALGADTISNFCKPGAGQNGKTVLNYQIDPSMVIHDGTLDVTFAQAGLPPQGEAPQDRLFSFSRTIGAILRSGGLNDDQASRVAFLETLIDSFDNDKKLRLNPYSAVLVPVDDRLKADGAGGTGEGSLEPARLLNASDPDFGMKPLALFNRFDLAPNDWKHCGEYRIVYAIPKVDDSKRFFLIFEAMVPNPSFSAANEAVSEAGCRPIAEFWAGLTDVPGTDDDAKRVERAKRLSQLYYDGEVDGQPALAKFEPVVSFRNYGGDGGRGQVRGNLFFDAPWQLREWLTQITVGQGGPTLAFVPETVKENPIAELYLDDLSATAFGQANIDSVVSGLHRDFVEQFGTSIQNSLFVERSKKFRDAVDAIRDYDLPGLDEDDLLVTLVALGDTKRFDEFQSHSMPDATADEPSKNAGPKFRAMLDLLLDRPEVVASGLPKQTTQILLNRAEAGTCAGCHQTAPREGIDFNPALVKTKAGGGQVFWPDVVEDGPGFVHVDEERAISVALKGHFLPVRHYLMGSSLCKPLPEVPTAAVELPSLYLDNIVQLRVPMAAIASEGTTMSAPLEAIALLPKDEQQFLVDEIDTRRRVEREIEDRTPGAFVDVRRAH